MWKIYNGKEVVDMELEGVHQVTYLVNGTQDGEIYSEVALHYTASANEIAKLCENLSIKDEDGEIHMASEDVGRIGTEDVNHCLVGKVLSGKRVNREAFKGPWHFDKCLLVLEKPEGAGEISKLKFNKAEFWVQIHDIPIMCMNRRMAKWLAEQIGEVIEIPTESRECWGKFLRVKVQIDITRPLKRWLRLSLDNSGNIVVVGLKYERLPEFCYACGRLGHGVNECSDLEAKKEAMEGSTPRFGSWMRALSSEKSKEKSSSQVSGGSSVRDKSLGSSHESAKNGVNALKISPTICKGADHTRSAPEFLGGLVEKLSKTTGAGKVEDQKLLDRMLIDGPSSGLIGPELGMVESSKGSLGKTVAAQFQEKADFNPNRILEEPVFVNVGNNQKEAEPSADNINQSSPNIKRKKWKRSAREMQKKLASGLVASPLQRKMAVSSGAKKTIKRNSISPSQNKSSPKSSSGNGKLKERNLTQNPSVPSTNLAISTRSVQSLGVKEEWCLKMWRRVLSAAITNPTIPKVVQVGDNIGWAVPEVTTFYSNWAKRQLYVGERLIYDNCQLGMKLAISVVSSSPAVSVGVLVPMMAVVMGFFF
ncbi:hypothetical protein EZV62_004250 [Acer yangbiense]|uniref:CCHC-type domain-containing protein n=1 Tax=Acer yangbiense TaxID=1000413 RepID=A0A5C7IJL6_9ROSI|nr:hypothetical protein EZV62_004250 [Acer yangbiense]